MKRLVATWVGVASVLFVRRVEASPEDLFGYGPRSSAMAATGTAVSHDFEAAYSNPALLSAIRARRLSLGFLGAVQRPTIDGRSVGISAARGVLIGADLPLPLGGTLRDRIALGLAMYTPSDLIVRGRILYPEKEQFPMVDRAASVTVRAGFGVDLGYGLRAGAGFAVLAQIVGKAVVATDATGRVGTRVENQLVATYSPTLGLSYDLPFDTRYRIGVAYRGSLHARFNVAIDATKLSSLNLPVFNISGLAQYDPEQVAFEVARIEARRTLALGFTWKNWSAYPGPIEPTLTCPEDNPSCTALVPPKLGMGNGWALRAGAEQKLSIDDRANVALRGGASFEASPLPSTLPSSQAFSLAANRMIDVPTRYYDADKIGLSIGAGIEFDRACAPFTFDIFAQWYALLPKSFASQDAAGTVLSSGEAGGHIAAFGAMGGVKF